MVQWLRQAASRRLSGWSARRHGADRLPLTIHRRRIYIIPTRFGIGLGLLLIAMLLAGLNYSSNLGLAFGFLMVSLAIVVMHHCNRNLLNLRVDVKDEVEAFAGGHAAFEFLLHNEAGSERRDIEIRCALPAAAGGVGGGGGTATSAMSAAAASIETAPAAATGATTATVSQTAAAGAAGTTAVAATGVGTGSDTGTATATVNVSVPARSYRHAVVNVPVARRGVLRLPRFELRTRHPLGWFRAWTYVQSPLTAFVAPQPRGERALPATAAAAAGFATQSEHPGDEDFAGLRNYQAGVPLKHMAWKVLARGGEPAVRNYSGLAAQPQWLDFASLGRLETEARLSQLCRWVLDAAAAQRTYGLRLPGIEIPPGRGLAHRAACLRALARYAPGAPA
jgi:uncharacterized protein (DUF58 family)